MSDIWFSPYTMRRRPVSGPIVCVCFRGMVASLGAGMMATLLFGLSTNSPIGQDAGGMGSLLWLLLPYIAMLVGAWWWTGAGVWRAVTFLGGCLALTGTGLYHVARVWFFVPPATARAELQHLELIQWAVIAGTLVAAIVPGLLIGRGIDRLAAGKPGPAGAARHTDTHDAPS
jgi:hypothetical protein